MKKVREEKSSLRICGHRRAAQCGEVHAVNRLVGRRSPSLLKTQTTRNASRIVTSRKGRFVFIDTPGLHEADSALDGR